MAEARLGDAFEALRASMTALPPPSSSQLVSIVLPFIDGDLFFDEAIASVVAQSCQDWELWLVDDGSIDASRDKALALAAAAPGRVHALEYPGHENRGQAAARNLALGRARGRYVAMLDIDDVWLPEKLERQAAILDAVPEAAMVYGPMVYWYGWTGRREDELRDFVSPHGRRHDQLLPAPDQLLQVVVHKDGLPAPTNVMIRREVIDAGVRFDESFGMYDDEVFLAQIALRWPVYLSSAAYELYRQHPDSFCAQAIRAGEYHVHRPNTARGDFLRWLQRHVAASGRSTPALEAAIEAALSDYEAGRT
jgi:glycosyltransferase involved in cell wall biosynthesis